MSQTLDDRAPFGRITKAAKAHRVISCGILIGAIRDSQDDPVDRLDDDVRFCRNSFFPTAGYGLS
jgi:hypothetical protein